MHTITVSRPACSSPPRARIIGRRLGITAGILGSLAGLLWAGLQVPPAPFTTVPQAADAERMPLPTALPAPVERFYRALYGDSIPVVQSAVISGRGTMRPVGGITFPARFRFTHRAGQSYRHYFETTLFGVPLMRVNEYYVDGVARMELPWGVDEGSHIDQAANLSLWGEIAAWMPAVLLTDSRVRWEAMDEATAVLVVPFGTREDRFVARFDPATDRLRVLESMRYKHAGSGKILWLNEMQAWGPLGGQTVPVRSTVTWADDGTPWLRLSVEELAVNVPVDTSRTATGP